MPEVTVRLILSHGIKDLKGSPEFVCQEIERLTHFEQQLSLHSFEITDIPSSSFEHLQQPLFVGYDE